MERFEVRRADLLNLPHGNKYIRGAKAPGNFENQEDSRMGSCKNAIAALRIQVPPRKTREAPDIHHYST